MRRPPARAGRAARLLAPILCCPLFRCRAFLLDRTDGPTQHVDVALGRRGSGACTCHLFALGRDSLSPIGLQPPVSPSPCQLLHTCGDCLGPSRFATQLFLPAGAALPGSGLASPLGRSTFPVTLSTFPVTTPSLRRGAPCCPDPCNCGVPLSSRSSPILLSFESKCDSRENQHHHDHGNHKIRSPVAALMAP